MEDEWRGLLKAFLSSSWNVTQRLPNEALRPLDTSVSFIRWSFPAMNDLYNDETLINTSDFLFTSAYVGRHATHNID